MDSPEIRYARRGPLHIAYLTAGSGPLDIVYVSNWTSNVEIFWETKPFGRLIRRLSTLGRVIVFDQPGTGLSDPVSLEALPTMEQWMDDMRIVMDEAGCESAALYAHDSATPLALLFAATHPERVNALVILNGFARLMRDEGYSWGFPPEAFERMLGFWLGLWGTGGQLRLTAPSIASDEREVRDMGRAERHSASPGVGAVLFRMIAQLDVRDILPSVHVPTLVLATSGDRWIRSAHGRYLAEMIPEARYIEIPGEDHWVFYGDMEPYIAEIQSFLAAVSTTPPETDRVLLTILFTDIVDSTKRAVEIGDMRWRELLDAHDRMVRLQLDRFRGEEVETTGDGFLAVFDGPARAIRCAAAIASGARQLGIEVRTGVHTGECERRGDGVSGIAVHVAARVMSEAGPGEVVASSTVKDLVAGSGLAFDDRGVRFLKGAGEWRLFSLLR